MPLDGTIPPPAIYDYQPTMTVIEYVLTSTEANKVCIRVMNGEAGQGRVWRGCARSSKVICYVWRIDDPKVKRHELAHCNGWPGDHPSQEVKEAVAKPVLPNWAHPTPQLPWPKIDPDIDTLKKVLTAAKELSNQIRR